MAKHTDAVKSYDEFRAPWETEGGEDAEIDKSRLKRWIYNLVKDKAKAQDARDEALEAAKTAEDAAEEAKSEAAKANPDEVNKKLAKLEKENAELKSRVTEMEEAAEHAELRAEVLEGLDSKYAKYVTGETREELEKSLEQVKKDFDLEDRDADEDHDDDDDDDDLIVRTRPVSRTKLVNVGDRSKDNDSGEYDFDKIADTIIDRGPFG